MATPLKVVIDPAGSSMVIKRTDGLRDILDLAHFVDRHVRREWVGMIHSSQGATCDRGMAQLESFRANTVDAASVYTDSRASLTDALGLRNGAQVGAINGAPMREPK